MAGSSAKLPDEKGGGGRADEHERLHAGERSEPEGQGGEGVSGSRDRERKPRHDPSEHRPGDAVAAGNIEEQRGGTHQRNGGEGRRPHAGEAPREDG